MRIRDLDSNAWLRISEEIEELAEEIMDPDGDEYPTGLVAAQLYELLRRASFLALLVSADPGLKTIEVPALLVPQRNLNR